MGAVAVSSVTTKSKQSKGYAVFLAVLPLIMMYHAPGLQLGIGSLLIAVGMVYAGLVVVRNFSKVQWSLVILLSFYLAYVAFKSTGANILLSLAIWVHVAAISTGIINDKTLRRIVESLSVIAAFCVILQQMVHLFTGVHIPMVNTDWLITDMQDNYAPLVATGMSEADAMYRPCAFFLEPAHFSQYVMFGLGSTLFQLKPNLKKAMWISLGLFATTSGMGFVIVFAIWGWWYITSNKYQNNRRFIGRLVLIVVAMLLAVMLLNNIPYFERIISRFTGSGDSDYNAIEGRLFFWDKIFGGLRSGDLVTGYGDNQQYQLEDVYMTGFMKVLYMYGIIGFTLLSIFLLYVLKKVHIEAKAFVLIYIGLLFLANLTGFIPMIFNFGMFLVLSQSFSVQPQRSKRI